MEIANKIKYKKFGVKIILFLFSILKKVKIQ